jgi:hypothetical protein
MELWGRKDLRPHIFGIFWCFRCGFFVDCLFFGDFSVILWLKCELLVSFLFNFLKIFQLMKKFLFVLMAAALALPMMAQTKADYNQYKSAVRAQVAPTSIQRVKANVPIVREEIPEGYCSVTLAADDVWGDGSGYQMLLDADANAFGSIIPESGPLTSGGDADPAVYAEFEYKIPENADGSCYTSNIIVADAMTIMIPAGVYDWCITNPTPDDKVWIASSNGSVPGRYDDFEFAAGGIYVFSVTYGGYNDQVDLEIVDPNAPVMPENVAYDPETGMVTWENDHDPAFNLRYRVYNPNTAQTLFWDFEDYNFDGWMILDNDGDGYCWGYDDSGNNAYSGNVCLTSASYNGEVLTPDNWLITPTITLGGSISFMAGPYSSYWPDVFAVYVAVGEDPALEDYVLLGGDYAPEAWTEFSFDLSEYAGEVGHVAIRHYNCTNQWRLLVDDVTVVVPGDEPNPWIYVNGVEATECFLEGLTAGTDYEVQVQAVAEDGRTSNWTTSTIFTAADVTAPTEQCAKPEGGFENGVDFHGVLVTLINNETAEGTELHYNITLNGELIIEDAVYDDAFALTVDGEYYIDFWATAPGMLDSSHGGLIFTIDPTTGLSEVVAGKTVANVRYFNVAGQEMAQPAGMTIVVTTYTDGTTNAVKVVK